MNNETKKEKSRLTEHISFYCSERLKGRIVDVSEKINESLSWTVRRLISVGLLKLKEGGYLEDE